MFLVDRKQCFFLLPRQQSVSYVQETVFLSFDKTAKCFLCTENSVSFFCLDNKVFLVHRKVFLSFAKTTKCFLRIGNSVSFAKTTKCFLCIGNSFSFLCQDNKVFLVQRKQHFFLLFRQQSVSCV